jgi:hypothetical protein
MISSTMVRDTRIFMVGGLYSLVSSCSSSKELEIDSCSPAESSVNSAIGKSFEIRNLYEELLQGGKGKTTASGWQAWER